MSFGKRLLEILDKKGLTRADLCRKTGLKSSYLVGYVYNPDRSPTLATACKIAEALDVSLDYLGGLIDEPRPIRRDLAPVPPPSLTDEERELVDAYRASDMRGRGNILDTAGREKSASKPDVDAARREA